MITEDYVSFEVAKLLKEKGFDEQCMYMYDSQHTLYSTFEQCRQITRNNSDWIHYVGKLNIVPIATPTHQMTLKWLREVHNIFIIIDYVVLSKSFYEYTYEIHNMRKKHSIAVSAFRDDYETYEEAVDSAIKYCLTNLI